MAKTMAFKVGQKVVFTEEGAAYAEANGISLQGATLGGPRTPEYPTGTYAVGTVTDCTADAVTVAVDGISGLGSAYSLDSWYAACTGCIRANAVSPAPPVPGKATCAEHAPVKKANTIDVAGTGEGETIPDKGEKTMAKTTAVAKGKPVAKEKAAKAPGAGRKSAFADDAVIEVLIEDNPRREGTFSHKIHAAIRKFNGKTVGACLASAGKVDAKFLSETKYILGDGLKKKHYKLSK